MLKRLTIRLLASFQTAYTNLPKPRFGGAMNSIRCTQFIFVYVCAN